MMNLESLFNAKKVIKRTSKADRAVYVELPKKSIKTPMIKFSYGAAYNYIADAQRMDVYISVEDKRMYFVPTNDGLLKIFRQNGSQSRSISGSSVLFDIPKYRSGKYPAINANVGDMKCFYIEYKED